jgi:hypothetical protein
MADNPKLLKLNDGLYALKDYKRPKPATSGELRKMAEEARKIQIIVPETSKR